MKRMKVFEMGTVALLLACLLRTCCIEEKSQKDDETEFFSTNFKDKVISVVRTRRLHSYDPVRWENPIPYDEGIFEKQVYASMYAIVVIDCNVDEWFFKRGTAECLFFYRDMNNIKDFCIYNAKNDTLKPCDGSSLIIDKVVDLEALFNRHKSCPCIFSGTGRKACCFGEGDLLLAGSTTSRRCCG